MKKILLSLLLAALLLCSSAMLSPAQAADDPVSIIVASDLHYLSPALVEGGELIREVSLAGDGKMMHLSSEISRAFFAQVADMAPDYLILSGDLTLNGARQSHQDMAQMLGELEQSGVDVLVIPGNHDVDAEYGIFYRDSGAEKAEALSSDEFMELYADFGPDIAVSGDGLSFSYSVDTGRGLRIIMLDANCYGKGFIKEPSLDWLEEELEKARSAGDKVITVSHQNLYAHNQLLSFGYQLYNSKALLPLLEEYRVLCNLSGHIHIQSLIEGTVPEIATSSLTVAPCQYGLIEYDGFALSYRAEGTDVSAWAAAQGLDNEELLDFARCGERFFMDNCRRQVAEMFAQSDLDEEQISLLQESFARLNYDFFAGRQPDPEAVAEGLELWKTQESSFMQRYIDSICAVEHDSRVFVIAAEDN